MNFSTAMAVHQKENAEHLNSALKSLAEQTLKADEVILVEDGNLSDELKNVIESYRKALNIHSIIFTKHHGLAKALNVALRQCKHEIVARMDSDDIALPERFASQIDLFKKDDNLTIAGTFAYEINSNGSIGKLRPVPILNEEIYNSMFACPFIHPSVMYKKTSILAIGGYNEHLKRRQDYDLWFRCAYAGYKFANIPEPLLLYRHTHKHKSKHSFKLLFQQGFIGFRGTLQLKQPLWKACATFFPLIRHLAPSGLNGYINKLCSRFDPRLRSVNNKKNDSRR